MLQKNQSTNKAASHSTAGFTLLEVIITAGMVGILSAIAAPSWVTFVSRQQLNIAQDQMYRAMQSTKSNAELHKMTWQLSLQENKGVVQWAVHAAESGTFIPSGVQWNNLDPNIQVYKDKNNKGKCETTLDQQIQRCPSNGPWRVQFNYKGNTNGQLGQLTLTTKNGGKAKSCVYVSTLIGTVRTGKEHSKANDSKKYCY